MERNQNRKFNRNLRDQAEFCSREDSPRQTRRHQHRQNTAEDLIPTERPHQRAHRRFAEHQGAFAGRGFQHRARSAHDRPKPGWAAEVQHVHPARVHPEPFTAPRDLMHEKWMLEMRIYRLKKRLHHLNRQLYEG